LSADIGLHPQERTSDTPVEPIIPVVGSSGRCLTTNNDRGTDMSDKKLTPEEIRKLLSQPVDAESLLRHEFEYYIWFRGHSHRLKYQRHEDIDTVIGRFICESGAGEAGDQDKVYVFRDFELWLTMEVTKWDRPGQRDFVAWNHWLDTDEVMAFQFDDPPESDSFPV
jgi:hypothetical protein